MEKNVKLWIFWVLITFLIIGSWCLGNNVQASVQKSFINQLSPDVINVAHKYNLYPSVMMAQAALESSFGQSSLAKEANNYFGVKGEYNGQFIMIPTLEYNQNDQPYYVNSEFRKYPNAKDSLENNAQLIRNGVYGDPAIYSGAWRENATDGITAAKTLGGKYATDPHYASDLVDLIQEYHLNSLLDNTWKRLHIKKLKKRAAIDAKRIKHYRKRYAEYVRRLNQHHSNYPARVRAAHSHSKIVKYTRLYRNDEMTLGYRYREYNVYDHLSKMDLDDWNHLNVSVNSPVYVDMMGVRNGHRYYRIRLSPSCKDMYWVNANALSFIKPTYYHHPYQITAHEMNLTHAYNHILGTNHSIRLIQSHFSKSAYQSNVFATVPNRVWYKIRNDKGRLVWLSANPKHPTQYLIYHKRKALHTNYTQAPLTNHAADPDYHTLKYSWLRVKPKRNHVMTDRLAIDTHHYDSFWYRINNQHRTEWTNEAAFK